MNIKEAIYTLLDKAKHRFRGAIGEGTISLGAIDSITPDQDGWLVITAQPDAGITIAPIIRVNNRTNIVYEYTGSMYSGGIMIGSLPVKKGETYAITYYRCAKKTSYIAYSGGGITLAISMLSALLRGCWQHEYQTDAICDYAEVQEQRTFDKTSGNTIFHNFLYAKPSKKHRLICSRPKRLHVLDVGKPKRYWSVWKFLHDDNKSITMSDMECSYLNSKCKGRGSRSIYQERVRLTVRGCVA